MNYQERKNKYKQVESLNQKIIKGKMEDWLNATEEERPDISERIDKDIQLLRILKKELNIK